MAAKREIALDTETTGLEPEEGHRMVEIGCVEMLDGIRTGKSFHTYLNPERDMPPEAERVHGLSASFLKDKPVFSSVYKDFLAFIGDATLIIHNASFDMKFINAELINARHPPLPMTRTVDTVQMAKRMFPGSPSSLDALCKRFNIDLGRRKYHGALLDAELLAEVYLELTGGRQNQLWGEAGQGGQHPTAMQYASAAPGRKAMIASLTIQPAEEENKLHEAFVAGMKSPVWKDYL